MTNVTPPTLRGYPATADQDLPPVIAVDPGARWTGVAARIGIDGVAATTIRNRAKPRPGGHPDVIPVHLHTVEQSGVRRDENVVADIVTAVGRMLADPVLDALARAWWARQKCPIPVSETPWLIAVELTVEPRQTPPNQVEKSGRIYQVEVREAGDYGATNTIGSAVGALLDPVIWIAPRSADDRWQTRPAGVSGGTGRREDYWPPNLLGAPDARVRGMRDEQGQPVGRDPMNHCRAAYSVATDAGLGWLRDHGLTRPSAVLRPPVTLRLLTLRGYTAHSETPGERLAADTMSGQVHDLPIRMLTPLLQRTA